MRQAITNISIIFVAVVLTLTGCLNLKVPSKIIRTTENTVIKKENSYFPIESFVITQQDFIFTVGCEGDTGQSCEPTILGSQSSSGSGFILKTDSEREFILTAGHICMPPDMSAVVTVIEDLRVAYRINLTTGFGRQATGTIIAIDVENDLCLLEASEELGPGLEIYEKKVMMHAKVYNMANPAGLASSLAVPVFEGYYIGDISMISLFTIPAVGGSSGSPIMNHRNEVISIVSAAAIRFDEYAIGPKTESIRKFLLAHLPKDSD